MTVALRETIAANLAAVRARIDAAAERARRDPADVTLVAVSKTFPAETVVEAIHGGVTDLGENRVQEGAEKIPAVALAGLEPRWHLIGHLQSNKARPASELFAVIQAVDSVELAERLDRVTSRPLEILLEVNVAGEASKFGLAAADVRATVKRVRELPNLRLEGLMTVAPFVDDPEEVRPVFRELRGLRDSLGLRHLSMGMSGDFEVAIEEGATIVRIGRAIFGERPYPV
jgi:pyridoxal phosphate enzyme (YggS family)